MLRCAAVSLSSKTDAEISSRFLKNNKKIGSEGIFCLTKNHIYVKPRLDGCKPESVTAPDIYNLFRHLAVLAGPKCETDRVRVAIGIGDSHTATVLADLRASNLRDWSGYRTTAARHRTGECELIYGVIRIGYSY